MIRRLLGAALAIALAVPASVSLAQDKLTALHSFPANWVYSRSFLNFVKKVNDEGKGIVQINYIGGPKAIPTFEQGNALLQHSLRVGRLLAELLEVAAY
jgi:hypothetical protein